jgi:hypothetical protein
VRLSQWLLLSALGLMAALVLLHANHARAAGEVAVDEGGIVVDEEDTGAGMPSSNPRVRPLLAAHPGQYAVICVAGCDGKPRIVQLLPRPVTAREGAFVPSTGEMGKDVYGPPGPSALPRTGVAQDNDVICLAGCLGRPGQVLQRISGLPQPATPKATKAQRRENMRDKLPKRGH